MGSTSIGCSCSLGKLLIFKYHYLNGVVSKSHRHILILASSESLITKHNLNGLCVYTHLSVVALC